jgi:hypothetical protein
MRDKPARREFGAHSHSGSGMSKRLPALGDFRRIVVKVGSSLLVDREGGRLYGSRQRASGILARKRRLTMDIA